jgi:hypothetical protein
MSLLTLAARVLLRQHDELLALLSITVLTTRHSIAHAFHIQQ